MLPSPALRPVEAALFMAITRNIDWRRAARPPIPGVLAPSMHGSPSGCKSTTRVPASPGPDVHGANRRGSACNITSCCAFSSVPGITITIVPFGNDGKQSGQPGNLVAYRGSWNTPKSRMGRTEDARTGWPVLEPFANPPVPPPTVMPAQACDQEPMPRDLRSRVCQKIHGWTSPSVPRSLSRPNSIRVLPSSPGMGTLVMRPATSI